MTYSDESEVTLSLLSQQYDTNIQWRNIHFLIFKISFELIFSREIVYSRVTVYHLSLFAMKYSIFSLFIDLCLINQLLFVS